MAFGGYFRSEIGRLWPRLRTEVIAGDEPLPPYHTPTLRAHTFPSNLPSQHHFDDTPEAARSSTPPFAQAATKAGGSLGRFPVDGNTTGRRCRLRYASMSATNTGNTLA